MQRRHKKITGNFSWTPRPDDDGKLGAYIHERLHYDEKVSNVLVQHEHTLASFNRRHSYMARGREQQKKNNMNQRKKNCLTFRTHQFRAIYKL